MAKIADKDLETLTRRMASLSSHFLPLTTHSPPSPPPIERCNTSADDSYHRVHGQVPDHPATWKIVRDDSGKEFVDIIYEKAVGEGIAKVGFKNLFSFVCFSFFFLMEFGWV